MNNCDKCNKELTYNAIANAWFCNNRECRRFHAVKTENNRAINDYLLVDLKDIHVMKALGMAKINKRAFE